MASAAALDINNVHKVLIRSTNWIGDAVMTTPAMGAVRAAFPRSELVVLASPLVSELFSPHPYSDRVVIYDKKGIHRGAKGLWRLASTLRHERFDLALLFQNALEAAVIAFLSGIPRRAGYRTDGRGFLLTHGVSVGRREHALHHTDYYLNLLKKINISGGDGHLRLFSTDEELKWARTWMEDGLWMAVNPGAAYGSAKRWIPGRFAAVGDALAREYGARILLTGGPAEQELGRDIEAAMQSKPLNLIGKTSVREMMALLSQCACLVTNDSGPMHVAAAYSVPIVALFGPTDSTTTSPLCSRFQLVRKPVECAPCLKRQCPSDHRCMEAIQAEDVLDAVRRLLKRQQDS